MIANLEKNTIWSDGQGQKFQVLDVIIIEDKTWVHYINRTDNRTAPAGREYSCYAESFLSRFISIPE